MIKKSFVSLYVSQKKLSIVYTTPDKKRVKTFSSVDLPEGFVVNSNISDVDGFSQIIKTFWKKLGIKEKTVELIIPELSAHIKTFDLPEIDVEELDEAVKWRVMDYLPEDVTNFVIDWEVVEEKDSGYKVMAVFVRKEILDKYILALEKAGLLTMLISTPSTVFFDYFPGDNVKRLVVCICGEEALVMLGSGRNIVASSAVSGKDKAVVINTVTKMLKYYSAYVPQKLYVVGDGVTSDLGNEIQKLVNLKSESLPIAFTGISKEQINALIIPSVSQVKRGLEPSDINSINLLPAELVKKYDKETLRLRLWSITLFISLIVWFNLMSTVIVYFYLGSRTGQQSGVQQNLGIGQERIELAKKVKAINVLTNKVLKITDNTHSPELIINSIYDSKPAGIEIKEYFIDLETGNIRLQGVSDTRVSLIDFKYKLEEKDDFSLVSVPVSNFENNDDFEFEMNFSYLPAKSVKQPIKK